MNGQSDNDRAARRVASTTRRRLLGVGAAGLALSYVSPSSLLAETPSLVSTPRQGRGPFYPSTIPADSDNDLVHVAGKTVRANGVVIRLFGRVSDERGRVLPGARIEIWQCNAFGRYHHPRDRRNAPLDPHFQGYGRFTTGDDGMYRFRTIRPVPYPGRAPHVHFAISATNIETLVTQMYVAGEPQNARDFLLGSVRDARARESLIVRLEDSPEAPGELVGRFDLVLSGDGGYAKAAGRLLEGYRRRV
jgi:protocatechuate 3,4-dioxygenase beta subunit